jgi:protoporphyrinogen oxidase
MDFDCVVIGAGLAGLTATRALESAGKSVILLESSDEVGGRVRSDQIDGFICDRGFQVINPKYSQVEKSGVIKDLDFRKISGSIRLFDENIKIGYAPGSISNKSGTLVEKIRFLEFVYNKNVSNSHSFGFYAKKFEGFYRKVLDPFLTGVFLTDPSKIAADVAQEILKSFINSLPGLPARGVGEFSKALAKPIRNLKLNESVENISGNTVVTTQGRYSAKYIVVAAGPVESSILCQQLKPSVMLSSTTSYFSTDEDLMDSKNLVISRGSKLVNSIVISKVSPNYAPAKKSLVSATIIKNLTDSEFRAELSKVWGSNANNWDQVARYEIKNSLALHTPGKSRYPNLQLTESIFAIGDHMSSPSQQGAMESGALVAEKINQLMR